MQEKMLKFINSHNLEIKPILHGFGDDVTADNLSLAFPSIPWRTTFTFEPIRLPSWHDRRYAKYHMDATIIKSANLLCTWHTLQHVVVGDSPGKQARCVYGHHCALVDAIELAFYTNTLKIDDFIKYCFQYPTHY